MSSRSQIEGGAQILSAGVRKTIQSIKEIVGNHSDADIYVALKDADMDPDETAQKLLNQDPFQEVRSKRDKKKENTGYKVSMEPRRSSEHVGEGIKLNSYADQHNCRGVAGISRKFRVVRDNRTNQNANREIKPTSRQSSTSTSVQVTSHASVKGVQELETNGFQLHSVSLVSNNSMLGMYSPSDPVHVPSLDSRSTATVGAIKREVGMVGVHRQSSKNFIKSSQSSSFSNSRGVPPSRESSRPSTSICKSGQSTQATAPESVVPSMWAGRSFLSSQYNGRPHQQPVGNQKASQPNKEWKPKSSQKSSLNGPGVIGTPTESVLPSVNSSTSLETEAVQLPDKLSQVNNYENKKVIIAEHIRVTETDRRRLTFGSFGIEMDSSRNLISESQAVGSAEESSLEPCTSLSVSAPESCSDETCSKPADLLDDQDGHSELNSPASGAVSTHDLPKEKKSSSPHNLNNHADTGLVGDNGPSYTPLESQQHQNSTKLQSLSVYDPQSGYDIQYFGQAMDEIVGGKRLPSPQEALSVHTDNIHASTIPMVHQQPPAAQMYSQIHVSHYANVMPYRQFLPPVYAPPVPIPGYSSNPSYAHPSNGSSYLLMPGGRSHLSASGFKYGVHQFKPVPGGSPTSFGSFINPTGYAINAPGVVGGVTGMEDSSRLRYEDGNLYAPNQQAETSEIWIQNPRELSGLQSASYYNMPGQTPHGSYLPSHAGHAPFNAGAHSSHVHFPGLYQPPAQSPAIANPHYLGGNVGVGVAPGSQVGAYQQPQLGHHNWTTNF